ncbi:hypothetical protein BYT27DRAFT_7112082 [Phlegmacium glaucopus]|nr:hypothetical protein BYT27DRAFT_7112082 [Phlegmacium glaucopus]
MGHWGEEAGGSHISEDAKTSSTLAGADLNVDKSCREVHQEPRKPSTRPRPEHGLSANARYRVLADENTRSKAKLEATQRDLAQTIKQSKELQGRVQRLQGEKEDLLATTKVERTELLRKKTEAEKQVYDLQGKNQKLEEELKMLKGTLRGMQEKHLHTTKLLEERTADLKGAQAFLTTVDRYAGAEIMKMVEALNAEIFQGAALISELLGDETTIIEQRKDGRSIQGVKDTLAQHIGLELLQHLSTKSKQVQSDPLPLQLAVQAILTSWCIAMVDRFCTGPASNDLREIYRRIWESEPQAVAGRWRAMTMAQAKYVDSTTTKDAVIKMLSNLLYLCGSPMANVSSQKTHLCLQQVVSTIMDMWMQLRIAIYEGVTTTEMKLFGARPNDTYRDAVMNDIYADTEDVHVQQPNLGKETGRILCTVGMGLQRCVVKQNGDGTMSVQRDTTLKAKVAFPSVLFDTA